MDKAVLQPRYAVSFKGLLAVYLAVPICLLVFFIDKYLLSFSLKASLPTYPHQLFIIHSLFGLPHILASTFILTSNRDYRQLFRKQLWLGSAAILAFLVIGSLVLPYTAMFFIIAAISVAHVLKQQYGIANALSQMSGPLYRLWSWSAIFVAIGVYNIMFQKRAFSAEQIEWMHRAILFALVTHVVLTFYWHNRVQRANKQGLMFLWSNCFMISVTAFLFFQDYYFLAVLAPRVIHDSTAFYIYVVHDKNKHISGVSQYRYLLIPVASIIVAYAMQHHLDGAAKGLAGLFWDVPIGLSVAVAVITFCNLLHYFTESFTWARNSPYRAYLRFSH